jgi:hypothetical protein
MAKTIVYKEHMKEPKKYKLNLETPTIKEPKKIRMEALDPNWFKEENKYDVYSCDPDSIFTPSDLKNKK